MCNAAQVCVRKRPLSEREVGRDAKDIIHCNALSGAELTVLEYRKRLDLTEYVGAPSSLSLSLSLSLVFLSLFLFLFLLLSLARSLARSELTVLEYRKMLGLTEYAGACCVRA